MKAIPAIVLALVVTAGTRVHGQVDPQPSYQFLTTGNGFGFQVFDISQNAITQFLENPYRYLRPNPGNPDGEGIVRRDLAFDTYFGINAGSTSEWLGKLTPSEVGYVNQTNVIRSVVSMGSLTTESFYFSPYGYEGNAMVMVLKVTNGGGAAVNVDAFSVHNFKMGSAPNPDEPGDASEQVAFTAGTGTAAETGPGGGALIYAPIGGSDVSSCAAGVWDQVNNGTAITATPSCSGSDKINVFRKGLGSIPAGETRTWGVAVLFESTGTTGTAITRWQSFLAGRDADALLAATLQEWEDWRMPVPGISADERAVWRQAEAVLRMSQILEPYSTSPKRKNYGMILASLPPGGWHTGWVRDAAYAIVALARTGHHKEAKDALNFFLDAEAGKYKSFVGNVDYKISTVRYFGNGEEEADYSGQPTRNIEIDGWGLFLWAARTYVDFSGDGEWLDEQTRSGQRVYDVIKTGVAEALAANIESQGMPIADASIWEVHWANRAHFAYTTATAARGFCDMSTLSLHVDELGDRDRFAQLSADVVAAMREHFIDQNNVIAGSIEKLAQGSNYADGAAIEALTWGLIPMEDPIAAATLQYMSRLRTPVGGFKRIEGSNDQYDTDEWILIDLRASDALRRVGQADQADTLLDFVTQQAKVNNDQIPELYNTNGSAGQIGRYTGSIPMVGYGAGAYMLTVLARSGYDEFRDCGQEIHDPGDGGPMYVDAGPGGAGSDAGIDVGRTGFACLCTTGGGRPTGGELFVFAMVAAVLIRRKRAR